MIENEEDNERHENNARGYDRPAETAEPDSEASQSSVMLSHRVHEGYAQVDVQDIPLQDLSR